MKRRTVIASQVAGILLILAFIRPAWKTDGITWSDEYRREVYINDCGTQWTFLWKPKGSYTNRKNNEVRWETTHIDWEKMLPVLVLIAAVASLVLVSVKDKY
ncbi:hypothetical protein [Geothrix sp.]|jgi:hypothetical protein|uniref:hypothetical protein n=1 Tax=Geothrix sp. TaxID=1962974 RepID=UPI0025B91190|nr:hypothetical protein [Geothrix sp.]